MPSTPSTRVNTIDGDKVDGRKPLIGFFGSGYAYYDRDPLGDPMKNALIALGRCLPARVREAVFHYGFDIARDESRPVRIPLQRRSRGASAGSRRERLAPRLIVDIGANSGEWTRTALSRLAEGPGDPGRAERAPRERPPDAGRRR